MLRVLAELSAHGLALCSNCPLYLAVCYVIILVMLMKNVVLANAPAQAETLLDSLERVAAGNGLHVNAH